MKQFNNTQSEYPKTLSVHQLFEKQAELTPDAIAIKNEDNVEMTYQELNEKSNILAHYLIERGLGEHPRVAVYMKRSLNMIVAILGTLKAGAAYVPFDYSTPVPRVNQLVDSANINVILIQENNQELSESVSQCCVNEILLSNQPAHNPELTVSAEAIAYVLYTSGSTGLPKGVMVPHQALTKLSLLGE